MELRETILGIKEGLLDILFPKTCLVCRKYGEHLCPDCEGVLEISQTHKIYEGINIDDLYFAIPYQNPFARMLIKKFKYEPFIKELAKPLSSLIINHLNLLDNEPDFSGFYIIPVPLEIKRMKWRGFNQSQELAKKLSVFLNLPLLSDCLLKTKKTLNQADLEDEERKENVRDSFACPDKEKIKDKNILLIDDVFTTGATMEECARVLKKSGAQKIIGLTIARG